MPSRTEAIKAFLVAKTHPDLAEMYNANMECQVNVAQDGGARIGGEFHGRTWVGWTDGIQKWKSFRIPRNANSNPEYDDPKMTFDLEAHAEGIGMTGWDWRNRFSRWVAFDFDAITGHAERHRIKSPESDLATVVDSASKLDWITVRKSTSGSGIHLYVHLEPVSTQNHNEHAALGRAILGKMSAEIGFDFNSKVDICAQNMWVWHRKMKGTDGLTVIKQGGILAASAIPPNWQEHIKVVTGHRRKTLPKHLTLTDDTTSDAERSFNEISGQASRIPLDEDHKQLIRYLEEHKTLSWWDPDHHMLVAHTFDLKEAHRALALRGVFDTLSKDSEGGNDKNCFLCPLRRGGWVVRRYSMGVQEHRSWFQDGQGWTKCYFNVDPDLRTVAKAANGQEDTDGSYVFNETEMAIDAAKLLGANIPEIPNSLRTQKSRLKPHKDGRLILEIEGDAEGVNKNDMGGWLHKKGKWTRIFNIQPGTQIENELPTYDDTVRHLVSDDGKDYGWVIRGEEEGEWHDEPLMHAKAMLEAMNFTPKELKVIIGSGVMKAWRIVNRPFQPEYPGNRIWNRGAAQFRYVPNPEPEKLYYPHWTSILRHVGKNLDQALTDNPWAQTNGVATGEDYLKLWIASLFKFPLQPLPYLFLYGEQNTGKSILHEALSLLVTSGYQRADTALINQSAFNEELRNAILCVVEEINLRVQKTAANRIKDWVTARQMPIHPKGRTPYDIPNSTHWIQVANDPAYCPVFPGDSRITMVRVDAMAPEDKIPKKDLIPFLEKEAADFLAEILRIEIPPSNDRLHVPVIETAEKAESARSNKTPLQEFLDTQCFEVTGKWIKMSELYEAFAQTLDPEEVANWSKIRFGRELPPHFPKGRSRHDGQRYVGNISFIPFKEGDPILPRYKATTDSRNETFLDPDDGNNNGSAKASLQK